jgi:hypothetical protein
MTISLNLFYLLQWMGVGGEEGDRCVMEVACIDKKNASLSYVGEGEGERYRSRISAF